MKTDDEKMETVYFSGSYFSFEFPDLVIYACLRNEVLTLSKFGSVADGVTEETEE